MEKGKYTNKGFLLLLIFFLILTLSFVKEENQQKMINIFNSFTSGDKILNLTNTYDFEEEESLYYYDGSVAKWKDNNISYVGREGNKLWEKDFDFMFPNIISLDKSIYIMDKYSGEIDSIDNKGKINFKSEVNAPIFNLKEDNNLLLIHVKDESIEKLNIVDNKGKIISEKDTINILTYSVSENGNRYVISSMVINDKGMNSKVSYYSLNKDEIYTVLIPDEVVIFTQIVGKQIIVLTDTSLHFIEDNEILWSIEYPLIKDIQVSKDEILLLYGDNIEFINFQGESLNKITFGVDYKRLLPMGNYITLYGDNNILILDKVEEIIKLKTEKEIVQVRGKDNVLAIEYIDSIELYDIVNKEQVK